MTIIDQAGISATTFVSKTENGRALQSIKRISDMSALAAKYLVNFLLWTWSTYKGYPLLLPYSAPFWVSFISMYPCRNLAISKSNEALKTSRSPLRNAVLAAYN